MKWILFLCLALTLEPAFSKSPFETPRLEFPHDAYEKEAINPGRYPSFLRWIYQKFLIWRPAGQKSTYEPGCEPEKLFAQIQNHPGAQNQAQLIENHLQVCQTSFQNGSKYLLFNNLRMVSMELDYFNHPMIEPVVIHLEDGTTLRGLLALRDSTKARPMILLRLGIFASVHEFLAERFLFMKVFEQGFANVLVIENTSGPDYIAHNDRPSFGGFEEGVQNLKIAQMLRDPKEPLSELISSLHLMGVSLGGHGVLFSGLLNDLNLHPQGKLIQSFVGICPAVNLKNTFDHVAPPNLYGVAVDFWASMRLAGFQVKRKSIDFGWTDIFSLRPRFLPQVIDMVSEDFRKSPTPLGSVQVPEPLRHETDFWKANDFWPYFRKVRSPVLVMATVKDHLVRFEDNFAWLREHAPQLQSDIGTVKFEEGYHCTLPIAYDWSTLSAIFNASILSYDPHVKLVDRKKTYDVSAQIQVKDLSAFSATKLGLLWDEEGRSLKAIWKSREASEKELVTLVPIDQLDFAWPSNSGPVPPSVRTTLERWLHQNLSLHLRAQRTRVLADLSWPILEPAR